MRGGPGWGSHTRRGQRLPNSNRHTLQVLHHLDRLESKYTEALTSQHPITNRIVLCLKVLPMLASIHLDHQAT